MNTTATMYEHQDCDSIESSSSDSSGQSISSGSSDQWTDNY